MPLANFSKPSKKLNLNPVLKDELQTVQTQIRCHILWSTLFAKISVEILLVNLIHFNPISVLHRRTMM